MLRAIRPFGLLAALSFAAALSATASSVQAADYDAPYPRRPPPPAYVDNGVDPRCRVIPQPEHNLYGDTARFRPTLVCMSRGLYADSFGPYPFRYPYTGGYGYGSYER